jgi:hypothetical protein
MKHTWRRWLAHLLTKGKSRSGNRRPRAQLDLELLENRALPSGLTPSVLAINRATPVGPETNASSVSYSVTFNESVTGVAAGDFQVTTDGATKAASPVAVTGSGAAYNVTVSGIHGSGDLRLDLIDNDTIQASGIPLGGPGIGNGSFQGQSYNILQAYPYVVSINRATPVGPATNASTVNFTVTFSEPVTGVNVGDFQLAMTGTVGKTLTQVTPVSGSVYMVTVSGVTGNGTLGLNLVDNGSIHDLAGNPLVQANGSLAFLPQSTFATGPMPESVAVADVNGDGIPDVIVGNSGGGSVSVLLGKGHGTFQPQSTFATGGTPYSVTAVDLNGDGHLDLLTVVGPNATVSVLLGNGNGTFQNPVPNLTGPLVSSVTVADVNGDGKPDLVVCYNLSTTGSVLLGNGNGTFHSPLTFFKGSATGALPMAVADLNGDGKPDLVLVAADSNHSETVGVLLGNGDGTFQSETTYATAYSAVSIAVADLNGDSKPDVLVANASSDSVNVLLGNGDGTFQNQITFSTLGNEPAAASLMDVNGDGKPDLIVAQNNSNAVAVFLGNGNGTFQRQQQFVTGLNPSDVTTADLNGDGRLDLVVADGIRYSTASVFFNSSNGNFTGQTYTIDTVAPHVVSINRAGSNPTGASTVQFTVTFSEPVTGVDPTDFQLATTGTVGTTLTQATPVSTSVYTVTVSGITGNGNLGLNLVDNGTIRDLAGNPLVQSNASASFQVQQTYGTGADPFSVVTGALTGDGNSDLVVANFANNTVGVSLGNGNGTFQAQQTFATQLGPRSVALGDFNGDHQPDLVVANFESNTVSVLLGNGNGTFQAQQPFATGIEPVAVATADVNGDGKSDIVVANGFYGGPVSVLLGNGDGTFQAQETLPGYGPKSVSVADLLGDNKQDIVVANPSSDTVGVYLGNGDGTFQAQQTFAAGSNPHSVAVGDFNKDGVLDLAVADTGSNGVSVLLGNGNGTFQAPQGFAAGTGPVAVTVTDVNGDGNPDLITANERGNNVSVLLGNGNGSFQAMQNFGVGSYPDSVAVADFNGDGRPDVAVANLNSNNVSVLLNSGNGNFTGQVYTVDTIDPFVVSINRADANPTIATTVHFTVTFSEPVMGVDPSDFALALTGSVTATTPVVVSGSGAVYTVTVSSISGAGTLGLNLVDNGSIHDLAGNPLSKPNALAQFQQQSPIPSQGGPKSVVLGDLNGDGKPDLVVTSQPLGTVSVFLGNGNGTFQSAMEFVTDLFAGMVALGDFTGDDKLDVVMGSGTGDVVMVLLGNGNGTLQAVQTFATGQIPSSVAVADVNGDGKLDLITGNLTSNNVSVLLGNGNGTFQAQQTFAVGQDPYGVSVADLGGDGVPDLAVVNAGSNSVSVLLGNGDGTFQAQQTLSSGLHPLSVVSGDVNGDGVPDLVVNNGNSGTLGVFLGNGNGTFQAQTTSSLGPNSAFLTALALGDVNGDGKPDVAFMGNAYFRAMLGNGDGTFQSPQLFFTGGPSPILALGDLNGDGRPDAVVAQQINPGISNLSVLLNTANGNFTGQVYTISGPATHFVITGTPPSVTAGGGFTFTVTAEDVNNNTAIGYTGTVHFTSSDGRAVLPANSTLASGIGTFSATLVTAGSQTLTATDSATGSITGASTPITVVAASATHLVFSGTPSSITAGSGFIFTVTAEDPFNNTSTSYGGTVHFASSDSKAVLPANATLAAGVGAFSATLVTAGSQTLTASDSATSSITGASAPITVSAAAASHFVVGAPAVATAGVGFGLTVTALDRFNNTATGYTGTLAFTTSDHNSVVAPKLPANSTLAAGVGTFSATLSTAGSQTLTATDSAASSITGASGPITVSAAAASHFAVTAPSNVTSGTPFLFTVTAEDPFNNAASTYGGTVHFSTSDSGVGVVVPTNSTLTAGVGTFSATLTTLGIQTITATDTLNAAITGSSVGIEVNESSFTHFVFNVPNTATAGVAFAFTVTAESLSNSVITSYAGTVLFSSSDTLATFVPASATLTSGIGIFSVTLRTAGSQTLTATDTTTSIFTGFSAPIAVSATAATHFGVSSPGTATAGNGLVFTVTAEDQFNNLAASYGGSVHFASSDSKAVLPANSTLTAGVGTFSATLITAGSQTLTATDVATGTITGASSAIAVRAAAATHFVFGGVPSATTAGTRIVFTVTAEDAFNNVATSYAGSVAMTSSDTAAVFVPPSKTFTSGVGTFSVTLRTAGNQTLTATDTVNSTLSVTSNTIAVSPAAVSHFVLGAVPSNVTAGNTFNLTVTALDAFNNLATGYTGTVVLSSTDTAASFAPPSATLTSAAGTFSVTLKTVGSWTVTAKDAATGTPSITTGLINVFVAPASHFVISGTPGSTTAGHGFGFTVTAFDPFNNLATGYLGTVVFSSSDSAAVFSPSRGTLAGGVGTFSATPKTAGNQTITAQDSATSSISGVSSNITVTAAAATHFAITGAPSTLSAGTPFAFTVTAEDAFNNKVVGYAGTVHFTSTDPNAPVGGSASEGGLPTPATLTSGVGAFTATLVTAGSQTLTVSDTVTGSIAGSATVSITALAANHFQVSVPTPVQAGQFNIFQVTALDRYNNVDMTYGGTVKFTTSAANAQLSDPGALTNGTGNFVAILKSAGIQTVTATDIVNNTLTGTSNPITVTPAGLFQFAVTAPNPTAGVGFRFTVVAQDQFDNTETNYGGTVRYSSTDGRGVLPANSTLAAGQGTFSATLATSGSQTLSATDTVATNVTGAAALIVSPGPATHFAVTAASSATAGVGLPFTVTAEDQFNNTASSYAGSVQFSSSDTQAGFPAPSALLSGTGVFVATLKTAGIQTVIATDVVNSTLTGRTGPISVVAATAESFNISPNLPVYPGITSGPNSFATTGLPTTFTVQAVDSFGNPTPSYSGTVQFASSDGAAVLPASGVIAGGVGTFSATLMTVGNQTLSADDTVNNIEGTSGQIVTRGLVVTSFATTPSGFVIAFNKAFDPGTVLIYTTGTTPDDIILATAGSQISVRGTALINAADTALTFVKTDNITASGTFNPAKGLLSAGNYTLTLRSLTDSGNGFQDNLGVGLDGANDGDTDNFNITFSVSTSPVAVGIPDFARGPSNTDAVFLPSTLTNGSTFALSYTNPAASPSTGTATITFSTNIATLTNNIQTALTSGGLATQIGVNASASNTPNSQVVVTNITSTGANVLVTFQSALATATNELLTSTTPGVSIGPATINVANNIPGNGIPIALSSGLGVTSGEFTLQYNPSLLTISSAVSKVAGASFSLVSNNTATGTAVLSFSSPSSISSTANAVTLGSLIASVPFSVTGSYGVSQLLHFSSEKLNGSAGLIAVTNADGVQVTAYLGDVTDSGGPLTQSDAMEVSAVAQSVPNTMTQTIPGFAAFPNLDPSIIGGVSLQGAVTTTDAGAVLQEVGGVSRITIPYAPIGLTVSPPPSPAAVPLTAEVQTLDTGHRTPDAGLMIDTGHRTPDSGPIPTVAYPPPSIEDLSVLQATSGVQSPWVSHAAVANLAHNAVSGLLSSPAELLHDAAADADPDILAAFFAGEARRKSL